MRKSHAGFPVFNYAIERPPTFQPSGYWFLVLGLDEEHICVTRANILVTFGLDDPRPHPGYPDDTSSMLLDHALDERQYPYLMRYSSTSAAPLEFQFKDSHCLTGVTIGDGGPHDRFYPQKKSYN